LTQGEDDGAYDKEIKSLGGRIFQLSLRRKGIFRYNRDVNAFFNTHPEYNAVHFHISSLSSVAALKAAKRNNIEIRVIHSHNSRGPKEIYHRLLHWWNQQSIDHLGTHYFSCSDLAAIHLYGNKLRNKQVSVIKNAIETEKFIYNEKIREIVRDNLTLQDNYVIGHIGSFSYAKNHDFLIDIFSNVKQRCPKAILLLVGDGPLRPRMEQKIKRLDLGNSVKILGLRSDIPELLQAMDVFAFPSLYEGLPVTGIEAQAAGLKCFFSDNITRQVDIAGLIKYIPLEEPANRWAEEILSYQNGYHRKNTYSQINLAGFDIAGVAEQLARIYLGEH
jgi:glycosyltransferase involved in cell wall biosynthesis